MLARLACLSGTLAVAAGCGAPARPHGQPAPPVAVASFVAAGELALEANAMSSDVGDFDGDGVVELAVGHPLSFSIVSMLDGRLVLRSEGAAPRESYVEVRAVDVDRDGAPDLLAPDGSDDGGLWLLRNDGRGRLEQERAVAPGFFSSFSTGDFNADGLPDVLAAGESVVVLEGQVASAPFKAPRYLADTPEGVSDVLLRDLTGDGTADLVVASFLSHVTLARGLPSGAFQAPELLGGTIPDSAVAADVDGDGVDDLLIGNRYMAPLLVSASGAGLRLRYVNALEAGGRVRTADLDLDGAAEVFSAFTRNPYTPMLDSVIGAARRVGSSADERFELVAQVSASSALTDFQVADFTGDGKVDIAALFLGGEGGGSRLVFWRGE